MHTHPLLFLLGPYLRSLWPRHNFSPAVCEGITWHGHHSSSVRTLNTLCKNLLCSRCFFVMDWILVIKTNCIIVSSSRLLHSDRDPIPDVPAIYFVMPTEENIDRICQVKLSIIVSLLLQHQPVSTDFFLTKSVTFINAGPAKPTLWVLLPKLHLCNLQKQVGGYSKCCSRS